MPFDGDHWLNQALLVVIESGGGSGKRGRVARKVRINYRGAISHMIKSGNYRSDIFETEGRYIRELREGKRPDAARYAEKYQQAGFDPVGYADKRETMRAHV